MTVPHNEHQPGSSDTAIYLPRARSAFGAAITAPVTAFALVLVLVEGVAFDRPLDPGPWVLLLVGCALACYALGVLSQSQQRFIRFGDEGITEVRSGGFSRFEPWDRVRRVTPMLAWKIEAASASAVGEIIFESVRWTDPRLFPLRLRSGGDIVIIRTRSWSSACLASEDAIEQLRDRGWLGDWG